MLGRLYYPLSMTEKTRNYLLRELNAINPILMARTICIAMGISVAWPALFVIPICILLLFCGVNPTDLVLTLIHDSWIAVSPIVAKILGAWILYTYFYVAIVFALTVLIRKPELIALTWLQALSTVLKLKNRVVVICQRIPVFSSCRCRIADFSYTDSLRASVRNGPPKHLATGWTPSINPQLE